jgi:hypothetical protein
MLLKNTNRRLDIVGKIIVKGLREELKQQKHVASGSLSSSIKALKDNKGKEQILNVISTHNKKYWQVVNNPSRYTFKVSYNDIKRWAATKGIPETAVPAIYNKLKNKFYGKPYVYWTGGNNLRRTDFVGYTTRKLKKRINHEVMVGIKQDAVQMVKDNIKKYIKDAEV